MERKLFYFFNNKPNRFALHNNNGVTIKICIIKVLLKLFTLSASRESAQKNRRSTVKKNARNF